MSDELRSRVLAVLTNDPTTMRFLNEGALQEELWTEAEWQDRYAVELKDELHKMVADGLLGKVDALGVTAYHVKEAPGA